MLHDTARKWENEQIERGSRIDIRSIHGSYGTATYPIGRKRDWNYFESQRPNGRTARALSDARAIFEIKKTLTSCHVVHVAFSVASDRFVKGRTTWSFGVSRGGYFVIEDQRTRRVTREANVPTDSLYTLFVGRVNDTEDGAELRPLHAWTPVAPTTPPKRVFGIPYCRLPSSPADFPPPSRHSRSLYSSPRHTLKLTRIAIMSKGPNGHSIISFNK